LLLVGTASADIYGSNFIPQMTNDTFSGGATGNITSVGTVHSATYPAWKAFNHSIFDLDGWLSAPSPGNITYIQIKLAAPRVLSRYTIYNLRQDTGQRVNANRAPRDWYMNASNDGSTWTIIDTQTGIDTWSVAYQDNKTFDIPNTLPYVYYQLNVTSNNGDTYTAIAEILMYEKLIASFTANQTTGSPPLALLLTDTSTGSPSSLAWGAKNLTPGNNTWFPLGTTTPLTTVLGVGNWAINLTATNAFGSNISTQVTLVNVSSGVTLPIVKFVKSKTFVMFPDSLYFNDTSENEPTRWLWVFGDGNQLNTTEPADGLNYSYQYKDRGRFYPNLTVSNAAGSNTSATQTVEVMGYQGFIPLIKDRCMYSTSRPLSVLERLMTDCKICGVC